MNDTGRIHLDMDKDEAKAFLMLLNRSVNTLLPHEWPIWLDGILERLEIFTDVPLIPRPDIRELRK